MFVWRRTIRFAPAVRALPQAGLISRRCFSRSSCVMQHSYTSPNITVEDEDKPKKKGHAPRTLQSLADEMEAKNPQEKKPDAILDVAKQVKTKRSDPFEVINSGSRAPEGWRKMNLPEWKRQKYALAEKFNGEQWNPNKKLSREAMQSVRILKNKLPELTATELSQHFQVSVEAIRRILKSKWSPRNDAEEDEVMARWQRRKVRVKEFMKEKKGSVKPMKKLVLNNGKEYLTAKTKVKDFNTDENGLKIKGVRQRLFGPQKKKIGKMEF